MIVDSPRWGDSIRQDIDQTHYTVIAKTSNLNSCLELLKNISPDLMLLDLQIIQSDVAKNIRDIKNLAPNTNIILLHHSAVSRSTIINPDIKGYLIRSCLKEELNFAIKNVLLGEYYFTPEVISQLIKDCFNISEQKDLPSNISERENEVLQLILKEYSNQEIAETLFISRRTVEVHKRNLLLKTNSKNLVGLVLFSVQNNLVQHA